MPTPLRIAVFASHGGSNLQSLIDACAGGRIGGRLVLVVSNNRRAFALERAKNAGIETLVISDRHFDTAGEYGRTLLEQLQSRGVELICLAGYMKMIPHELFAAYRNKIINVHPALLPKFGGQGMYGIHVHEAVIEARETESGATIHIVDEDYDHGRVIAQQRVAVLPGDTPETLQARVLKVEHQLYPETVAKIAAGEIILE